MADPLTPRPGPTTGRSPWWSSPRAVALPLAVTLLLFAIVGPAALAALLAGLLVIAVVVGPRVSAGRLAQGMFFVPVFSIAIVTIATAFPQPAGALLELRTPWRAFGGATLLVAVLRLFFASPWGGVPATLGLTLVGFTACGGVNRGWLYPAFVVLFLGATAFARRYGDPGHGPLTGIARRRAWAIAALGAVAAAVAVALVASIPQAHRWAVRQVMQRVVARTGFSDRLDLGDLRGLLESEDRVLRIRGGAPPLLRGVVYNRYKFGRWSHPERIRSITPPMAPVGDDVVAIEFIDDEPKRYFLPPGARDVAVSTGYALVDRMGILAPVAAEPAQRVWYRPGESPTFPVDPPAPEDLRMPVSVFYALKPYAEAWTRDTAADPTARLQALARELGARHAYSLDNEVPFGVDPVVSFIREGRSGHCEHFASSFALLARTLSIPARVVGGYRVTEYNAVGGYALVRERDAHAWVEAWDGARWRTFDPTPAVPALASRGQTPWLAAVADAAGSQWLAFLDWLDARTPAEMLVPPSVLILLLLAVRTWRRRRFPTGPASAGPLACFQDLSEALSQAGLPRHPAETPVQWANRIVADPSLPGEAAAEAAALLHRYAALRYGQRGHEKDLARDVAAWTTSLRA
ncbi:MAG: transglutaminase domain-containing protein [Myxococcota bacterium]